MSVLVKLARSVTPLVSLLGQLIRDPGEPKSLLWAFAANSLTASFLVPARLRTLLLRILGINISPRALVRPRVIIRCAALTVGPRSTINYGCVFDNRAGVEIGASVGVGIGVKFLTTDHDTRDSNRRAGAGKLAKVVIEDGVYIGSGAVILPGVTVRRGAVVGAGAVVTRDCDEDGVYAGIPARRVKELQPDL